MAHTGRLSEARCPCGATGPCANPRCHIRTGCLPGQITERVGEDRLAEIENHAKILESACYLDTPRDNVGKVVAQGALALCAEVVSLREALAHADGALKIAWDALDFVGDFKSLDAIADLPLAHCIACDGLGFLAGAHTERVNPCPVCAGAVVEGAAE